MKNNTIADKFRYEGNNFYRQGKFYEALISFNKSLCHAFPESIQLALAYGNRSLVYLRLKQFDKCLDNIQLARDNNHPNEMKLKEHEEKCKEELKNQQPDPKNDPWTHFKLLYPGHKKIPFIADCLEVHTDEKYGRHIHTNRNLNPGDVIAIEEPIFKVLEKGALYSRCTYCLKSNMLNLIPCNYESDTKACSSAMYCNQGCLSKGRDRFHGAFCQSFDTLLKEWDESTFLETMMIWKALLESLFIVQGPQRSQVLQDFINSNKRTTIFDYDFSNQQEVESYIDLKYLSIFNNLEAASDTQLELSFRAISMKLVQLCSIRREIFPILIEYSTRLAMIQSRKIVEIPFRGQRDGSAILSLGSLYSHTCDNPAVTIFPIDNKFIHIVLKPIKKGEQVFFNYGFHYSTMPRVERQQMILNYYNFICSCPACAFHFSVSSLTRYDPHFVLPTDELPGTIEDTMIELEECCKYIKDNFKNKRSYEVHHSFLRFRMLVRNIEDKSIWPY